MDDSQHTKSDHDLLIELSTLVKYVIRQMESMANDIKTQNDDKISKSEIARMAAERDKVQIDHETRLRVVESFQENSVGRNTIISALVTIIITALLAAIKFHV
jgi:hypothetical protein